MNILASFKKRLDAENQKVSHQPVRRLKHQQFHEI